MLAYRPTGCLLQGAKLSEFDGAAGKGEQQPGERIDHERREALMRLAKYTAPAVLAVLLSAMSRFRRMSDGTQGLTHTRALPFSRFCLPGQEAYVISKQVPHARTMCRSP